MARMTIQLEALPAIRVDQGELKLTVSALFSCIAVLVRAVSNAGMTS